MSRKSWVVMRCRYWAQRWDSQRPDLTAFVAAIQRDAIDECLRQCEGEQYAAEAQLKILALLEPGDEGEAP